MEMLSEHLMDILDNIRDLMAPFQKQMYYSEAMSAFAELPKHTLGKDMGEVMGDCGIVNDGEGRKEGSI